MSRVINFRAWDKHNKEMTAVNSWLFSTDEIDADNNMGEPKMTYHYEIMQFINSQDGYGNDIFEGDIVQAPSGNLFVVKWHQEQMRWAIQDKDTWYNLNAALYRVVGNIHQNPELL